MSVTIRDVAQRASVSIATVSRVLNNTVPVHEDKRARVLEAARALGYMPNPAALSLLSKHTHSLGVLLPFAGGEFFSELITGIDQAAHKQNYHLLISTSHRNNRTFRASIQSLEKRVDGLLIMGPEMSVQDMTYLVQRGEPVICINTPGVDKTVDHFHFDNFSGVRAVTQHLLTYGHRQIALIRGPLDAQDAKERIDGYRVAMAEAGLTDTALLEINGDYTQEAGYAAVPAILALTPRPTAIIAANDYCAMGVLSALHEHGIRVPDEMSVAGFDNVPSAQYTAPSLTSVQVPIRDIGAAATRRLIEQIETEEPLPAVHHMAHVELVNRQSTGPAPTR
ncbi:MAG: LacI family DNA-binding transcriptional regulator [Bacteroidota bacterium]